MGVGGCEGVGRGAGAGGGVLVIKRKKRQALLRVDSNTEAVRVCSYLCGGRTAGCVDTLSAPSPRLKPLPAGEDPAAAAASSSVRGGLGTEATLGECDRTVAQHLYHASGHRIHRRSFSLHPGV